MAIGLPKSETKQGRLEAYSENFPSKKIYSSIPDILQLPNLIQVQHDSYDWFWREGLRDLLNEISPIRDSLETHFDLSFLDYKLGNPRYSEEECRAHDISYVAPLKVKFRLLIKETGEIKEQDIFMGDFPQMTERGTFVINGAERVIVSQLVRSPGVYFTLENNATSGGKLCFAKLIPNRGTWLEFETSNHDIISVKVDHKHKILITTLLRAVGCGDDEELLRLFSDVDTNQAHQYVKSTIAKEPHIKNEETALLDIYKKLKPGDPPSRERAQSLVNSLFFNPHRYDLGKVGRYKLNKRLGIACSEHILTKRDFVEIARHIIMVNNEMDVPDDIDYLGNRRVRSVGELLQNQLRVGLIRLERMVKDRMSILDSESATPASLINNRPIASAIGDFFGRSQLSQFMDQTNPLSELTHKRRLSALGPGGISREHTGFQVRDVHHSHYGRICPIETPEGPNVGLIVSLANYARINEYGFIETPYRKVIKELEITSPSLVGRTSRETILDEDGNPLVRAGQEITGDISTQLTNFGIGKIAVSPFVSKEIQYLTADEEELYFIAQANIPLNKKGEFLGNRIEARQKKDFFVKLPEEISFVDVSPKQIVSVTTSLIPFLEHDDANRALMGSNMQRQAVPVINAQSPIVSTGMEKKVAQDSGQVIFAKVPGKVTSVTSNEIRVKEQGGEEHSYSLMKFIRSNQGTAINQCSLVNKGDLVTQGQILADSYATDNGELALGQNVLCAFLSWKGYNYEDAIIISERLVRDEKYTSIHIQKYETSARVTKLGSEEITRDIPNVSKESLRNLDERGIIRIGASVKSGDILVGKITPKGEKSLTAEERLLLAIFGEKARDIKDSSLRAPHGNYGKVIDVKVFSKDNTDELPTEVNEVVKVFIAQKRKISEGDKMSGRHGNKGVISKILPVEDMPFLPDGRSIDIVLSPLGVPSRMNIGQLLETHLGFAANTLGFKAITPVFDGASDLDIEDELARSWIVQHSHQSDGFENIKDWLGGRGFDGGKIFDPDKVGKAKQACLRLWLEDMGLSTLGLTNEEVDQESKSVYHQKGIAPPTLGKMVLRDGQTGEPFDQPVTTGYIYMMKLIHLVEDKVHARSTGPYSLITQQPLGGKAQFGGQRFGEMEVWALEAYGAAHALQEMLTIKSDDVTGRVKAFESIVKGENVIKPGVPESFKVLVKELQSLGLAVETLNDE